VRVRRAGDDEDDGEDTRRESLMVRPLCRVLVRELYSRRHTPERGISFEQIIALIESSKLVQVLEHPNAER
jgi:hypothetical protein